MMMTSQMIRQIDAIIAIEDANEGMGRMIKIRTLTRPWAYCDFPDCKVKAPHELHVSFPSNRHTSGTYGVQFWYCPTHLIKVLDNLDQSANNIKMKTLFERLGMPTL